MRSRMIRKIVAAVVLAFFATPLHAEAARQPPASETQVTLSFAPVVKKAAPAVVNVYAQRIERTPRRNPLFDDPIFRRFFGEGRGLGGATAQSLGSGVIVDPSGLVVTNNHVVADMTEVKVALADRREFPADILLRDTAQRSRHIAHQGSQGRDFSGAADGRFRRHPGRRPRFGDRRSLRRRPDRDPGHHFGPGAHAKSAFPTMASSSRPTPRSIPAIPAAPWWT